MARQAIYQTNETYNIGYNDGYKDGYEEGYMVGCLETKEQLINKACEWLQERLQFGCHPCNGNGLVEEFRKVFKYENL